jgi:PAS domain S-box-containing protein
MADRIVEEMVAQRALHILENIEDAFFAVDREWRLTYVNPHQAQLWGAHREDVLGKVVWDLFPTIDFPKTEGYRIYQRAFTERIQVEEEFFSIAVQGWVRVNLYPTADGGMVVHNRDVSEQHAARVEQQRLLALVRRLNEERGRLMAVAGHDLRQPLQIISAALYRLSQGARDERERRVLKAADTAMERMKLDLDMLAIASELDQEITPRLEPIALGVFLEEQVRIWQPHAEAKRLALRLVGCSLDIVSDRSMLRTILHNLMGNAIKYSESGGILVGCRRRGDQVSIEVIDRGAGIPAALHEQIFQAFRQLDGNQQGLGLGLSIVKRTAESLGCRIEMSSRPGHGSRFAVLVPRVSAAAA